MTDLVTYTPAPLPEVQRIDPTGGRLVAWAKAASAANQLAVALTTTTFVPKEMRDPGDATAAILMGDELGLSPLAALRSIYVVHGTPALYARSMVALALSAGHAIWTESSTEQSVTVCGQRRGSNHVEKSTWTIQRATKAGYTSNKKYSSNPQEMLYSKAAAEVARKVAADVLAGLPYSVEDLELEDTPTTTVSRPDTPTRRVSRAKPEVPEPEIPAETPTAEEPTEHAASDEQRELMFTLLGELGITEREKYLALASWSANRTLSSTSDMSREEKSRFIDYLQRRLAEGSTPAPTRPESEGSDLWAQSGESLLDQGAGS